MLTIFSTSVWGSKHFYSFPVFAFYRLVVARLGNSEQRTVIPMAPRQQCYKSFKRNFADFSITKKSLLLVPSQGWKQLLALSHLRQYKYTIPILSKCPNACLNSVLNVRALVVPFSVIVKYSRRFVWSSTTVSARQEISLTPGPAQSLLPATRRLPSPAQPAAAIMWQETVSLCCPNTGIPLESSSWL